MSARRTTYGVERLGALSDGVFSIVLTLLVLDLKVPYVTGIARAQEHALTVALRAQIPSLIAWIVSFVLVARFWVAHHAIVASLARCHVGTMAWNFFVLAVVSLVPFGASLIGSYEFDPVAVSIFSAIFAAAGLALGMFARHASSEIQLRGEGELTNLKFYWRYHATILPLVAVVAVVGLLIDDIVALVVWAAEPLVALWVAILHRQRSKGE